MYSLHLFSVAAKALSYEIRKFGFVWDDLTDLNVAILRHKIVNRVSFVEMIDEYQWKASLLQAKSQWTFHQFILFNLIYSVWL